MVKFETKRLIVRTWEEEDAPAGFDMYSRPEVMRFLGNSKPTESEEKMLESIRRINEHYGADGHRYGSWPLIRKEDGALVGAVLLKNLPNSEKIEVGWHLNPKYWGNGYATEAGRAAIEYGFKEQGLDVIYAVVFPENGASIRVTQRLGMKPIGRTSDYYESELEMFEIHSQQSIIHNQQ